MVTIYYHLPGVHESNRSALERLYEETGGRQWSRSDGWLTGVPLWLWEGVETTDKGVVVGLHLCWNSLRGEYRFILDPDLTLGSALHHVRFASKIHSMSGGKAGVRRDNSLIAQLLPPHGPEPTCPRVTSFHSIPFHSMESRHESAVSGSLNYDVFKWTDCQDERRLNRTISGGKWSI